MPLHEFETEDRPLLETKVKGADIKYKQVILTSRKLIEDAELPTTSTIYMVDLDFYCGTKYIDHCQYELHFNSTGSAHIEDFAHIINFDGKITHTILQVVQKPPLNCKESTVPVRRVHFNEQFGEHQVKIKLSDIFEQATKELGKMGFPDLDTNRQSYRLNFAYYYLNRHIKTASLVWNPNTIVDEREDYTSEEYVELLTERPDHVRLLDLRVDTVSLYWLQDMINKTIDYKMAKSKQARPS